MITLPQDLAVQSWCFRHFTALPDLTAQIHSLGLSRVELCAVHADFNNAASHPAILQHFEKEKIHIASIGVQTFKGHPDEEKWFAFAEAAGSSMIATTFDLSAIPAVFDHAAKLADKYNINLGIHNHGGYDWLGNFTMLDHLLKNLSPRIGLCLDTAWCLHAAGNPVEWAQKLNHKLFGIHIKDFTFDRAGKWTDVIIGTGNLDLPAFLKAALPAQCKNLSAVTLEYEGDVENPTPALKQCLTALQSALP